MKDSNATKLYDMKSLNAYIDHTLLKPTATADEIITLCEEAKTHAFYAVCINSGYLDLAKEQLRGSEVKLAAVIGFPLGAMATEAKVAEARFCVNHGANEIDTVINLGWLRSGLHEEIVREITQLKHIIGEGVLKVILETCYLSDEEIRLACDLCLKGGADYVKTSTGFGTGGATLKAVSIMKESVGEMAFIKASGGIRDRKTALEYIRAGANRIGTSSGIRIMGDQ